MEAGMAFIQNLLDNFPTAHQGGDKRTGSAPKNLLDALESGEESFISTLRDLAESPNLEKQLSPTLLNSLLSEATDEGINLTAFVELIKERIPLFSDTAPLKDFVSTSLGNEKKPDDTVSDNESELRTDTVVPGTGKQVVASFLEASGVGVEKGAESNGALEKKEIAGKSSLPFASSLKKGDIEELKSDVHNLKPGDISKGYDASLINNEKIVRMNAFPKKEDIVNKTTQKATINSEPGLEKNEESLKKQDNVRQLNALSGKEDISNKIHIKSFTPSNLGPIGSKEGEVKPGSNIPKEIGGQREVNSGFVNAEKVLLFDSQGIAQAKQVSEKVDKDTLSVPESEPKPNAERLDKTGSDFQRPSLLLKDHDPNFARTEKMTLNNGQNSEKAHLNSDVEDEKPKSHSESGREKSEEGNWKNGADTPRISTLQNKLETDSSGISRNPQFKETTTDIEKVSLEEKSKLQKYNPLDSEKGEKDRFVDSLGKENSVDNSVPNLGPKYQNTRPEAAKIQVSDQDMTGSKVVKLDAASGEDAQSSSNNQFSEKGLESVIQTKGTHTVQKPFQNDVMSQLVEKAILSLKNGQSSINIRLKPDVLGHLRMQITTENSHVMIKILTEVPLVKEIIESNANQLRAELQNQGLEMEKFDVSVDQGLNQNQGARKNFRFQKIAADPGDEIIEEGSTKVKKLDRNGENLVDFFA